mgnify:FL=1
MRTIRFLLFIIFSLAAVLLIAATEPPENGAVSEKVINELSEAFNKRLEELSAKSMIKLEIFTPEVDSAYLTEKGDLAVIWLVLRDEYGRKMATEPGLALAKLVDGKWEVILSSEAEWDQIYSELPEDLLPAELQPVPKSVELEKLSQPSALTGYYLPFVAGTKQWLEGSISHFQYIPELGYPSCDIDVCRYAYDFTNVNHFPLVASKEGTVIASKDSCSDGNPYCTNYIVLKDTNGETYQLYLHLSYGTIPDKLQYGSYVKRGQYIGDTDDTGYSTSNHVHFMVVDSLWEVGGVYWGRSIDVRFADVSINNGLPRTCYEVSNFPIYDGATECMGDKSDPRNPANDWFVSGNVGAFPPTGTLTRPVAGATVAAGDNSRIDVTATASDDVRVKAVQLVAKLNNQWVEIGPKVTQSSSGTYDWDVDLCSAAPVNGDLDVALRVWDHEGNVASVLNPRTIYVDHACPPPNSNLLPAESFDSTATLLTWEASQTGAGILAFDLQWRTEAGDWTSENIISIPGNQRLAWFVGQAGSNYAFRIRAIDQNNQVEIWPDGDLSETSASMPTECTPDDYEPDDDISQASEIKSGDIIRRSLCDQGDSDWFIRNVSELGNYQLLARSVSGGAAVKATLFYQDGETVLSSANASGAGQNLTSIFEIDTLGTYYIKIEPLYPTLFGTEAIYELSLEKVFVSFLPMLSR